MVAIPIRGENGDERRIRLDDNVLGRIGEPSVRNARYDAERGTELDDWRVPRHELLHQRALRLFVLSREQQIPDVVRNRWPMQFELATIEPGDRCRQAEKPPDVERAAVAPPHAQFFDGHSRNRAGSVRGEQVVCGLQRVPHDHRSSLTGTGTRSAARPGTRPVARRTWVLIAARSSTVTTPDSTATVAYTSVNATPQMVRLTSGAVVVVNGRINAVVSAAPAAAIDTLPTSASSRRSSIPTSRIVATFINVTARPAALNMTTAVIAPTSPN